MHKGRRDEHKQTDHLNANVLEQDKQSSQKARSIKTPWSVFSLCACASLLIGYQAL